LLLIHTFFSTADERFNTPKNLTGMFDSPFFNSVIAIITLYLVFSQLTLSLVELPAGFLNARGNYLHDHLLKVFGLTARDEFYKDAAIKGLMLPENQKGWMLRSFISRWPAYISETLFAQTVVAWVSKQAQAPVPPVSAIQQFAAGLVTVQDPDFKGLLETLYASAIATAPAAGAAATPQEQSQALQKNLEAWFHEYGERMTGWYKRDNRKYLFLAGLLVAMLADVDTVRLARFISDSNNVKARMALVTAGTQAAQGSRPAELSFRAADSTEAAAYNKTQVTTWNDAVKRASADLKNTLAAVPQVGLPLGFVRWSNHEIDTVYKQVKDTMTVVDAKSRTKTIIPAPTPKRDSVKAYQWAATADDFGMPPYAQRQRLNSDTGRFTPLGDTIFGDTIFFGITWQMLSSWLLTAFTMMLGAPFWFDTLCRFVNIRNIGIKPAAAGE
jgi:hypothetical protein